MRTHSRAAFALVSIAALPFAIFACSKTAVDTNVTPQKPQAPTIDTIPEAPGSGAATAPADPGVAPLAPLNPGAPTPAPHLPPGTHAVRTADGGVQVVNDAGAPVALPPGFQIPTAWAIPTTFPSGFPTALPSNLAIPSTFPSAFALPPFPGAAPTK